MKFLILIISFLLLHCEVINDFRDHSDGRAKDYQIRMCDFHCFESRFAYYPASTAQEHLDACLLEHAVICRKLKKE